MNKKIDLVISRYNETLDWLTDYKNKKFNRIFIYNKGDTEVTCPIKPTSGDVVYKKLPNVGRCDHTYIYHIIEHYSDLGDVTIFTKASTVCHGRNNEMKQFNKIIEKVYETGNSAFVGDKFPTDIGSLIGNFTMSYYVAQCRVNVNSKTNPRLFLAEPRPFSAWYKKHFPEIKNENRICYRGIFSVSKEHIHHRKKEDYKPFLKELEVDSNPEAGHFVERSWFSIFYKIPDECFYNFSELKGGKITHRRKKQFKRNKYTRTALKKIKDISVL